MARKTQINEAIGNKSGMAAVYGNLRNVYRTRGELDKAVEMHNKALAINQADLLPNKVGKLEFIFKYQ